MMKPAQADIFSSVGSTMAGFIVWLSHQRLPREDRQYCAGLVEQFLRWRHRQREQDLAFDEEVYCSYLQATGAPTGVVEEARAAIARLRQYLLTTS
jgi:hypothetical protein